MFDIRILKNPVALRKSFLATDNVAPQKRSRELRRVLAGIQSEASAAETAGHFWIRFLRAFPWTTLRIVLLRVLGTGGLLVAILASGHILIKRQDLLTGFLFVGVYFLFQTVEALAGAWARRCQGEVGLCMNTFFLREVNTKLLRIDHHNARGFSSGNLKILISSDAQRVSEFLVTVLWNVMPAFLCILILGPFIIQRMGLAGLAGLLACFGTVPLLTWLGRYTDRQEGRIKAHEDRMATIVGEWVANVRLLRYLGWQERFQKRTAKILRNLTKESMKQHLLFVVCYGLSFMWWLVPIIVMLAVAVWRGIPLEVPVVFSVIWMFNHLQGFVKFIPNTILKFNVASACIRRLERFRGQPDLTAKLREPSGVADLERMHPIKLVLEGVRFGYSNQPVIDDISTVIDLGAATSLIGTVGSGKTTFLRLLAGELKPNAGKISVVFDNGLSADLWHRDIHSRFRRFIGLVPQESYLSNATLAANISLDDEPDEALAMEKIYFAGLEADIDSFEQGLHQEIGENGINLSGGQKQRVTLARSFYSGRSFLLLDDPLSAVDTETEGDLMAGIVTNAQRFFIASHRLAELTRTDRLMVMEKGRIVEDGRPVELLKNKNSRFFQQINGGREEG